MRMRRYPGVVVGSGREERAFVWLGNRQGGLQSRLKSRERNWGIMRKGEKTQKKGIPIHISDPLKKANLRWEAKKKRRGLCMGRGGERNKREKNGK